MVHEHGEEEEGHGYDDEEVGGWEPGGWGFLGAVHEFEHVWCWRHVRRLMFVQERRSMCRVGCVLVNCWV